MKINLKTLCGTAAVAVAGLFWSCSPNDDVSGNGLTPVELDSSFTITQTGPNRFQVTATDDPKIMNHFWDSGTGPVKGAVSREIFLPDVGTYTITHSSTAIGGFAYSSSQTVEVLTPDPVAGNLIQGGKFETADDIAQWSIQAMNPAAHWTFANGEATLTSGPVGWAQEALYQAIQVEGGHQYKFDMKVTGPGWTDSVFELYADYVMPSGTGDYSAGGKVLSLNTWGNCGNSAFTGQLFNLSCDSEHHGLKTFPTSGTVYVLVRGGGANGNFNITIDNVEVRRND